MRKWQAWSGLAVLMLGSPGHALAQEALPAPPTSPPGGIPTLDEVRALQPDEEILDLYRFENPVELEPNRFDRAWRPPPSPEQVSMQGGYVIMGINYLLYQGIKGLGRVTGGPGPIQAAIARPPPLDDAQLLRAAAMCDSDGALCDSPVEPR